MIFCDWESAWRRSEKMKSKTEQLQHIKTHIERFRFASNAKLNLEQGIGNISACLLSLASNAMAEAMEAWFVNQDIVALRNWMYVAGLLEYKRHLRADQPIQPLPSALGLLKPLISNNESLIQSVVRLYEATFQVGRINDVNTRDFLAYQFLLAVRGDWEKLKERAWRFISTPPKGDFGDDYLADHQFFSALADGDVKMMESSIEHLLSPKLVKKRYEDESGFTQSLIISSATIYMKIASRHGYVLMINSPHIPSEWIGNHVLSRYDAVYSFLR